MSCPSVMAEKKLVTASVTAKNSAGASAPATICKKKEKKGNKRGKGKKRRNCRGVQGPAYSDTSQKGGKKERGEGSLPRQKIYSRDLDEEGEEKKKKKGRATSASPRGGRGGGKVARLLRSMVQLTLDFHFKKEGKKKGRASLTLASRGSTSPLNFFPFTTSKMKKRGRQFLTVPPPGKKKENSMPNLGHLYHPHFPRRGKKKKKKRKKLP